MSAEDHLRQLERIQRIIADIRAIIDRARRDRLLSQTKVWITISPEEHPVFHVYVDCPQKENIECHNLLTVSLPQALRDGRDLCEVCEDALIGELRG